MGPVWKQHQPILFRRINDGRKVVAFLCRFNKTFPVKSTEMATQKVLRMGDVANALVDIVLNGIEHVCSYNSRGIGVAFRHAVKLGTVQVPATHEIRSRL